MHPILSELLAQEHVRELRRKADVNRAKLFPKWL
jgi:hypothetical protein